MASGTVKIQLADDGYQIVVEGDGGGESGFADYGEPLDVVIGGERYLALVEEDPDDADQVRSALGDVWVYYVSEGKENVALEDVEAEGEEGDEESDDEPAED